MPDSRLGATAQDASEELLSFAYHELHRLAVGYMGGERRDHTLQPTALLNEAYVKLVDRKPVQWDSKEHFVAVAAQAMRRILIDHARGRGRDKRGGDWDRVTLGAAVEKDRSLELDREQLLSLDAAIEKLAALDSRQARIVELRFFGGLNVEEVARVLEVSKRTVEGDWSHARAWLRRELSKGLPS